ncbi:MAG: hypothetical protein GC180_00980 [Bacteroidetes bacterium]|nr:hypothetical protein [Bacteroidota bacterium]
MKWINASGLILQFVAFWLAAPELLGEVTLKRFEKGLHKLIARIPSILFLGVIIAYALLFAVRGLVKGIEAGQGQGSIDITSFYLQLGIASCIYFAYVLFYKRINRWIDIRFAQPLSQKIIHNQETRKLALVIGAICFSLGFLLQLFAVLWTA